MPSKMPFVVVRGQRRAAFTEIGNLQAPPPARDWEKTGLEELDLDCSIRPFRWPSANELIDYEELL